MLFSIIFNISFISSSEFFVFIYSLNKNITSLFVNISFLNISKYCSNVLFELLTGFGEDISSFNICNDLYLSIKSIILIQFAFFIFSFSHFNCF